MKIKNPADFHQQDFWWERVDSDHRSETQQIYSLPPLATREHSHIKFLQKNGAGGRTRTPDLLITNQLLYQLSYTSVFNRRILLYQTFRRLSRAFLNFFQEF